MKIKWLHPHLGWLVSHTPISNPPGNAFLATNVPRYADINTQGIYGNTFGTIPVKDLKSRLAPRIKPRKPFTKNNILSLAAPNVGGTAIQPYTKDAL